MLQISVTSVVDFRFVVPDTAGETYNAQGGDNRDRCGLRDTLRRAQKAHNMLSGKTLSCHGAACRGSGSPRQSQLRTVAQAQGVAAHGVLR